MSDKMRTALDREKDNEQCENFAFGDHPKPWKAIDSRCEALEGVYPCCKRCQRSQYPWYRDNERTQFSLRNIGISVSIETVKAWTNDACEAAEIWSQLAREPIDGFHVELPDIPNFLLGHPFCEPINPKSSWRVSDLKEAADDR